MSKYSKSNVKLTGFLAPPPKPTRVLDARVIEARIADIDVQLAQTPVLEGQRAILVTLLAESAHEPI